MLIVGADAAIPDWDGSGEARGADAKWPQRTLQRQTVQIEKGQLSSHRSPPGMNWTPGPDISHFFLY